MSLRMFGVGLKTWMAHPMATIRVVRGYGAETRWWVRAGEMSQAERTEFLASRIADATYSVRERHEDGGEGNALQRAARLFRGSTPLARDKDREYRRLAREYGPEMATYLASEW